MDAVTQTTPDARAGGAPADCPSDRTGPTSRVGDGMHRDHDHYRRALDGLPLPAAYVDRDLLGANIAYVRARSRLKQVRVASKSVRSVAMLRHILDADERFRGIMSFTAPEAVHLAGHGFDDLLVAYPTWDRVHVEAALNTIAEGTRITLMVDSDAHVEHLGSIAAARGVTLPVCIEIDMSRDLPGIRFGVWRSPIRDADEAVRVARRIEASSHLHLDGLMGYEAQIAGLADRAPGAGIKAPVIRALKRRDVHRIAELRAEVVDALEGDGHALRFVNGGGTGSLETTANERAVTEVTVGSGFYGPGLFDHYDAFRPEPAAGFALRIVRRPAPGVFTCLGGGYVASGPPGPDRIPVVHLPAGARLTETEAAGEVQTPVLYDGPVDLDVGDPVLFRHAKAGELCERFDRLLVIAGGAVVDEVSTYRGEGRSFL